MSLKLHPYIYGKKKKKEIRNKKKKGKDFEELDSNFKVESEAVDDEGHYNISYVDLSCSAHGGAMVARGRENNEQEGMEERGKMKKAM